MFRRIKSDASWVSRCAAPSPPAIRSVWPLRQDVAEEGVVFVFIDVVYPHMPLQIVRPGILVFAIRAERAHIPRRLVDQAVPDHLILALEALAALASRASLDGAVVGPGRRVYVGMRVEQVLGLERGSVAAGELADETTRLWVCHVVDAHPVRDGARGRGDLLSRNVRPVAIVAAVFRTRS